MVISNDIESSIVELRDYIEWAYDDDRLYKDEYCELFDKVEKIYKQCEDDKYQSVKSITHNTKIEKDKIIELINKIDKDIKLGDSGYYTRKTIVQQIKTILNIEDDNNEK
jgi:predicted alpha/beta hydrolase